ncbi:hypothetical protein EST38_g3882 [Candolleomyces aberdarensis]|uniref:DUF6535 domain-containing protein n=1 Tax=Candolleomyces aberdarensis TaxID=2316362 RepID=A0A4Q2DPN0_9AGAR|nr:hypothetical protein EST38_g3882 [Candolleomyces aberdarensis]
MTKSDQKIGGALFSAVVTAFIIESSKLFEPDPQAETVNILLGVHQLLQDLAQNTSTAPSNINSNSDTFKAPSYAVAASACWYLSLLASLFSVRECLSILRWIREFQYNGQIGTKETLSIRYHKLQGIEYWDLPGNIDAAHVFLDISLYLFLAGLLVRLFNSNRTVAMIVAIVISSKAVWEILFLYQTHLMSMVWQGRISSPARGNVTGWAWRCACLQVVLWIHAIARGGEVPAYIKRRYRARDWVEDDLAQRLGLYRRDFRYDKENAVEDPDYDMCAELGVLWVAQTFRNDSQAASAFMQCVENLVQSRGRDILSQLLQNSERHKYMSSSHGGLFLPLFQPLIAHPCYKHLKSYLQVPLESCGSGRLQKDIFISYSVDYFAHNSPKLQKAFLNHRLEVFLRILNGASSYTPSTESPGLTVDMSRAVAEGVICSFIEAFSTRIRWWAKEIPKECRIQYFETAWIYVKSVRVQRLSFLLSEDEITLDLLVPWVSEESPLYTESDVFQRAIVLNHRMVDFISQSFDQSNDTIQERLAKSIVYVTRIYSAISDSTQSTRDSGGSNPDSQSGDDLTVRVSLEELKSVHGGEYMESFVDLVKAIYGSQVGERNRDAATDSSSPQTVEADDFLGFKERETWRAMTRIMIPALARSEEGPETETSGPAILGMAEMSRVDLKPKDEGHTETGRGPFAFLVKWLTRAPEPRPNTRTSNSVELRTVTTS